MTRTLTIPALLLSGAVMLGACATAGTPADNTAATKVAPAEASMISESEVLSAQQAWGASLVQISSDFAAGGPDAARATAETVLDTAYGYNLGPVLFKPTLTTAPQTFRTTRDGALAYFVGQDPNYPKDTGFALGGWTSFEIENAAIFIDDDVAISMGKVRLVNAGGNVTEVDKTWGYKKDADGKLRIVLHHSSLPYQVN